MMATNPTKQRNRTMSISPNESFTSEDENVLEVAGILGLTPDEAAELSTSEVAVALGKLKAQENDPSAEADLLTDASRIA